MINDGSAEVINFDIMIFQDIIHSENEIYDFQNMILETQGSSRSQFIFNFQLKTNKERNKLTKEQTAKEKKHGAKYFPKLKLFQKFSQYIFISWIIPVWNCALAIS